MPNFFTGSDDYTLDYKGRVQLYPPLKEACRMLSGDLSDRVKLAKGPHQSICAWTLPDFDHFLRCLARNDLSTAEFQHFSRTFHASVVECPLDQQGRIRIPAKLLQHAEIEKDLIVIGHKDHIEFWNPGNFEQYENLASHTYNRDSVVEEAIDRVHRGDRANPSETNNSGNGSPDSKQG